jgi:hypothetical protein
MGTKPPRAVPSPAVAIIDQQTGLVQKDWYNFFLGLEIGNLADFPTDAAAAVGGVPIHGLYRSGSTVRVRVT